MLKPERRYNVLVLTNTPLSFVFYGNLRASSHGFVVCTQTTCRKNGGGGRSERDKGSAATRSWTNKKALRIGELSVVLVAGIKIMLVVRCAQLLQFL